MCCLHTRYIWPIFGQHLRSSPIWLLVQIIVAVVFHIFYLIYFINKKKLRPRLCSYWNVWLSRCTVSLALKKKILKNFEVLAPDNFWLPTNLTVVVCTHIDLNFYSINNKRIFVHNSNFLSLIFTFSPIFTKERGCVTILVVFNQTFCVAGSQLHHVFQEPQPDDLKQKINKDLWDTTTSVITKTSEISEVNVSKNSYSCVELCSVASFALSW